MRDRSERAETQPVMNEVPHQHAAWDFLERVAVMPELVGPEALLIDEGSPLLHGLDFRDPRQPQARHDLDLIGDDLTFIHLVARHADDAEAEIRRRDLVQIPRGGKEVPRRVEGDGEALFLRE